MIVSGAKVSDKLPVLIATLGRLKDGDSILIGGAMANDLPGRPWGLEARRLTARTRSSRPTAAAC